uniref:Zmp:0000000936 n=1 Tax=Astyanax mexicanus TaxID=7994 RepID=A0A3B1JFV5_ASTMX
STLPTIPLLFVLWPKAVSSVSGIERGYLCEDHRVAFERVFTVPQEAALLTCHLVNKHLFDVVNTTYNVTWYDLRTGLQITGEEDHTVVKGESLWFLNSTVEHQGKYLCVVRTPESCYKQAVVLKVSQPNPRECGRPQTALQLLKSSVNDNLVCPLNDYAARVTSYSIQWYKGCELLQEGPKFAFIGNKLTLLIRDVSHTDAGLYTCRMTFVLGGVISEAAETIECMISEAFECKPDMIEPTNEDIKVTPGSRFMKRCRVFIPVGRADHLVTALWVFNDSFVSQDTSDLPDLWLLPTGLFLTALALLFTAAVFLYRVFQVEITLAFRTHCPYFYESTDGDGKLYDAYVAYPRFQGDSSSEAVEIFALKTLPQVLEGNFGYRLFILGRDSLPGQAVVDVVEETLCLCRRLLLLTGVEWMERQVGMHQALLEGSLKVALLEMEEVSDPSSLPEPVRLLRERQGAVEAWQKRKRWSCQRGVEKKHTLEEPLTLYTLPTRFWREVRYHMPVRGKAKPHSKRNVLLNV